MPDKILARHPDPTKQGVKISAAKYHDVRQAVETILAEHDSVTFESLVEAVENRLARALMVQYPGTSRR
jgi:hypothetical protein